MGYMEAAIMGAVIGGVIGGIAHIIKKKKAKAKKDD